ncbi:MAG: hypothetical protein GC145_06125 [Caulobacter sp.]|nr:hypothetical protein [Caulobacter sp.]
MTRFPARRRSERGSGRALTPMEARKAWKALCEKAAQAATRWDEDPQLTLTDALKAAPRESYPLPAGDARSAWPRDLHDQASRFKAAGTGTRAMFAASLLALAGDVERLTHALSTEEAARYRGATGQRDD